LAVSFTCAMAGGATVLAATAVPAYAAPSNCQALPASFGYTEFSPGTVSEVHGDSDGPTAYGGNGNTASASINTGNFAISNNQALLGSGNVGFVAGGTVNGSTGAANSTALHYGNGYYDGNITGVTVQNGYSLNAVSASNLPVDFGGTAGQDASFATQLGALTTTPGDSISSTSSSITLTATAPSANGDYIWDLPAGTLTTSISSIFVSGVPAGGSVIVNVPDSGVVTLGSINVTLDGQTSNVTPTTGTAPTLAGTTIFDFYKATTLTLAGEWSGVLYAPAASTTFSHGHVWGSIDAADLSGTNESTYGPLSTLCVATPAAGLPEGRPVWLAAGGLIAVGSAAGVMLRRRRRTV
jgi:choice-of-anchor A domain-containing protein